jgi:hypothetical protein
MASCRNRAHAIARILFVLCLGVAGAGCRTRAMFVPPSGPGEPAPEAASAWAEANAPCRDARAYVAALRVSGRVGTERIWPVSIDTAVTVDQSIYLGATAAGQSIFVLAGTSNRATLWLRRDERTVTATPAEILEAVVGVPFAPDQLLAVLTGCVARSLEITRAARHGGLLTIETADARVQLERRAGQWRTKAAQTDAFIVEFGAKRNPLPADVWIWSAPGRGPAASLHVSVGDPEVNGDVPPAVFRIPTGAANATPMTLEQLRAAGPWRERAPAPIPETPPCPAS